MSADTGWLTLNLLDGSHREYVATPEMLDLTRQVADGCLSADDWFARIESLLIFSGQTPPGWFCD
ncbi:hypothetical protein JCM9957A_21280 [Kineosporia succinea]